jgi:hypothetical protein
MFARRYGWHVSSCPRQNEGTYRFGRQVPHSFRETLERLNDVDRMLHNWVISLNPGPHGEC